MYNNNGLKGSPCQRSIYTRKTVTAKRMLNSMSFTCYGSVELISLFEMNTLQVKNILEHFI